MWYLSGAVRSSLYDEPNVGFMLTPRIGNRVMFHQVMWAADTDCYAQGPKFQLGKFLGWLDRMHPYRYTNLFVTAPDVVGDALATVERSLPVLPLLRERGWRAAFVGQDGLTSAMVPWAEFDTYFIGGTTDWKLSQASDDLVAEAVLRGKWVHMGRVNSRKRLLKASSIGCSSADGTYLAYGPDTNLPKLRGWLSEINALERQLRAG